MQFTAYIMCGASLEARATINSRDAGTPGDLATYARAALLDSGLVTRRARSEPAMSLATLHRIAEIFSDFVEDQQTSGASREITVYTINGEVHQSEGQIALLTKAGELTCTISAIDDAHLERDSFRSHAEQTLGRTPTAEDIRFEDASVDDLFKK